MAQVPADVQADQVFNDILGYYPHQININAADASAIDQPALSVAQNPVQAQAEPVQNNVSNPRLFLLFLNLSLVGFGTLFSKHLCNPVQPEVFGCRIYFLTHKTLFSWYTWLQGIGYFRLLKLLFGIHIWQKFLSLSCSAGFVWLQEIV